MYGWLEDPDWRTHRSHTDRWDRALLAFGEPVSDTSLTPVTDAEAQALADIGMTRWVGVAQALKAVVTGTNGADTLNGQDGNDELRGGDGNDDLSGGEGEAFIQAETSSRNHLANGIMSSFTYI